MTIESGLLVHGFFVANGTQGPGALASVLVFVADFAVEDRLQAGFDPLGRSCRLVNFVHLTSTHTYTNNTHVCD